MRRLHTLTAETGLPRIRVHDLRHFAATTMLSSQVPLAMASKAMRHSTLSTTTEVYGHLLRHVAHQAVDAIDTALRLAEEHLRSALPLRPPPSRPDQAVAAASDRPGSAVRSHGDHRGASTRHEHARLDQCAVITDLRSVGRSRWSRTRNGRFPPSRGTARFDRRDDRI